MIRWLFVIAACSKPKPPEPPPAPPPLCAKVADHLVSLMAGAQKFPPEATDPFRNVVNDRCQQDKWSVDAQHCLLEITAFDQGEKCQQMLTPQQVEAFVAATQDALGQLHSQLGSAQ